MNRMYYFAYGSNMDVAQMKVRCKDSILVDTALLCNYEIVERQYADIQYKRGSVVPGALWLISMRDLESLDRYEGYPKLYTRKNVKVITPSGKVCKAIVYEMTEETKVMREYMGYSEYYRELCSNAADDLELENYYKVNRYKKQTSFLN